MSKFALSIPQRSNIPDKNCKLIEDVKELITLSGFKNLDVEYDTILIDDPIEVEPPVCGFYITKIIGWKIFFFNDTNDVSILNKIHKLLKRVCNCTDCSVVLDVYDESGNKDITYTATYRKELDIQISQG